MERSTGVKAYGIAIIAYGVYNLLGAGGFKQFALMFKGLPNFVIFGIYVFTILYGICGVYCGSKILKLEDWARKFFVALTSMSVILGLSLNRLVTRNLKEFLLSDQTKITPDMFDAVYGYTIAIIVLATIFELSIIFFFTRPGVVRQFRSKNEEVPTA
ncbi:MAG: hypothetical protein PVH45_03460 [Candidatus Omnitrophota bacterium]|jgi:hypothetical protein